VNRRIALSVLMALLVVLALGPAARAATREGPRLAVVEFVGKGLRLVTIGAKGGDPVRLAGGRDSRPYVDLFSQISWSPDGNQVAFGGIVGFRKGDGAEPIERLFTVGADGTDLRPIPKTTGGSEPVFSPDGHTVAFTKRIEEPGPTVVGGKQWEEFEGSSIWTVDVASGALRQLTPWRPGLEYVATSFSPDGSTLLASLDDSLLTLEAQPVVLRLDGSISRRIYDDGSAAVYSPDGSMIAFVRGIEEYGEDQGESTDLFVIKADGTGLRRLTRTPGRVELSPSWDPSGERLAYVRLPLLRSDEAPFGYGNALMQINADGTCQTKVAAPRLSFFFVPAWQPGPGREAGRIEC
jgi:Tol biopolymer transport system component